MASRSIPVLIPVANVGMMPKNNRFKVPSDALARARGVVFSDDAIEKDPGATLVDSVTALPLIDGIWGTKRFQTVSGVSYVLDASTTVTAIDTAAGAASRSSFTLTSAGGTTGGNDIVVAIAGKNMDASLLSVADDQSNTYTLEAGSLAENRLDIQPYVSNGQIGSAKNTHSFLEAYQTGPDATFVDLGSAPVANIVTSITGVSTTANSAIIVAFSRYNASAQFLSSSVTDTAGNTYTRIHSNQSGSFRTEVWAAYNTTALSSGTITLTTFGVLNTVYGCAMEVLEPISALYDQETATATTQYPTTAAITIPASDAPVLIVGVHFIGDKQADETFVPGTNFTSRSTANDTTNESQLVIQTRSVDAMRTVLYRATNTTALGAGDDITVSATSNTQMYGAAFEFSGFSSVDQVITGGSETAVNPMSVGPFGIISGLPSLIVGACMADDDTATTFTQGTDYALLQTVNDATKETQLRIEWDEITSRPSILAMTSWESDLSGPRGTSTADVDLTGTISTTQGYTTVVGQSGVASFTTEVRANDFITVGTETHRVASVTDDENLETTDAWQVTNAGVAGIRIAGRKIVTYTSEGVLYKEEGDDLDAVTLASGLSTTARSGFFTSAGREATGSIAKLFFCNGVDTVQVIDADASSAGAISNPNTDWSANNQPVGMTVHGQGLSQYLIAYGVRDNPHVLYWSDGDDHEDFTTANPDTYRLPVVSAVGRRIMRAVSFNGILFVFKWPEGIFYIDDSDIDRLNWATRIKSTSLGIAPTPHAVLPMDDDVLFMAQDGSIHLLSAVNTLSGTRASDLSFALGITQWIKDNVNRTRLNQVQSVWNSSTKTAYFGVPGTDETQNTLILRFDFGAVATGGPVRFSYTDQDAPEALASVLDITTGIIQPMLGETGAVYVMNNDTRAKNGNAYTGEFWTARTDLGDIDPLYRNRLKSFDALELLFADETTGGTVDVDVYIDGAQRGTTLSFDASTERERRTLQVGQGYDIQLRGSNSTVNDTFKIIGFILWVTPAGEDQGR